MLDGVYVTVCLTSLSGVWVLQSGIITGDVSLVEEGNVGVGGNGGSVVGVLSKRVMVSVAIGVSVLGGVMVCVDE